MEKLTEQRGKYNIDFYKIKIDKNMKEKALKFSTDIILSNNQYNRLLPKKIIEENDKETEKRIRIQRTYIGKLGELIFLKFLEEKNIKNCKIDGMFEIYQGQSNTDSYDFITKDKKTIDIKTGFRKNHKRLVINKEQFENAPKDYYVAIKFNFNELDVEKKIIDLDSIDFAFIYGYAEYKYLERKAYVNLGEGEAKTILYNRLMGIDNLLKKF